MVTHNPEIAEEYSTRIIKLVDGLVVSDTNPFKDEIIKVNNNHDANKETAKMSFPTAFKLSLRNLISKFKRTILVCIAGSIGIVGVSTVLAVKAGVNNYIISMQDDMLSGNPITISEVTYDLNGLLNEANAAQKGEIIFEEGKVNVNSMIQYLIEQAETLGNYNINNNITQEYIDYLLQMPEEDRAAIVLDYGISMSNNIYTDWYYSEEDRNNNVHTNMSISSLIRMYTSVFEKTQFAEHSSYVSQLGSIFAQAPNNSEYIASQYDILEGKEYTLDANFFNIAK
jgi:putative ABC transport system permease protein